MSTGKELYNDLMARRDYVNAQFQGFIEGETDAETRAAIIALHKNAMNLLDLEEQELGNNVKF